MKKLMLSIAAVAAMVFGANADWVIDTGSKTAANELWTLTYSAVNQNVLTITAITPSAENPNPTVLDISGLFGLKNGSKTVDSFTITATGLPTIKTLILSTGHHVSLNLNGLTSLEELRTTSESNPHTIDVNTIYKECFKNLASLTGDYRFVNVSTIQQNAFDGCSRITSICIEGSFSSRSGSAPGSILSYCSELTNITYVTTGDFSWLGSTYCRGDAKLTSFTVNGIEVVQCPQITAFFDRNNLYGCVAYAHDVVLTNEVVFGASVGASFFQSGVTGLYAPRAKVIEKDSFSGCVNLKGVPYLPQAEDVKQTSFSSCTGITACVLMNAKYVTWAFTGCNNIEEIILPAVTNIGRQAFDACSAARRVVLGGDDIVFTGGTKSFSQINAGCEILWNTRVKPRFSATCYLGHSSEGVYYVRKEVGWTEMNDSTNQMIAKQEPDGTWYIRWGAERTSCKQKLVFMDAVIAVTVTKDGEPIFKTMLPGFVGEDASYTVPRSYAMMPDRKFASVVSTTGGCSARVAAKGDELRITVPAAALPAAADDRTQDLAVTVDISDCGADSRSGLMLIVR